MTVAAALRAGERRLAGRALDASREARLLLGVAAGISAAQCQFEPEHTLDAAALEHYAALLERRAGGEPYAYLAGEREFWSLPLHVSAAVLVPRPETELLVERALRLTGVDSILDVGTGSGAIALAIASERTDWRVTATDLSIEALAVARSNAKRLALQRVEFLQGSWFEPVQGRVFDCIVSNPPYIAADELASLAPELQFEPRGALTPGADGLAALRILVDGAPLHLTAGGALLLEHGAGQASEVRAMLVARGYAHVVSHPDLAGLPRVAEARWG